MGPARDPDGMHALRRGSYLGDAAVATLVVVGLYGLSAGVQFQPAQVPGYLLIVFFDVLEAALGPVETNFELVFAAYLLGLGLVGGAIAQGVRRLAPDADGWRVGAAGALVIVGAMALAIAAIVLVNTDQIAPVLITGATGLAAFGLAGYLLDVVGLRAGPRSG